MISQSMQRSAGILCSSSSLPSERTISQAASVSPFSKRAQASRQPGPPPDAGIVPPASRPPTRALSSQAVIALFEVAGVVVRPAELEQRPEQVVVVARQPRRLDGRFGDLDRFAQATPNSYG